jgi:hypothetical protein
MGKLVAGVARILPLCALLLLLPALAASQPPEIVHVDTFREGVLVFFRLSFTDPGNTAVGFGFRGVNGSTWAEENHPFSSPSYGRVFPGRIEYPFNHLCSTPSAYESDVQAWIYDTAGQRTSSGTIHLACSTYFIPGTEVPVTSPQTIGPLGGIVQAPPGSPLAGVSVEFPAGALPKNSQISLAYNTGYTQHSYRNGR